MKHQVLNVKFLMFLLVIVLLTYGTQGISYAGETTLFIAPGETGRFSASFPASFLIIRTQERLVYDETERSIDDGLSLSKVKVRAKVSPYGPPLAETITEVTFTYDEIRVASSVPRGTTLSAKIRYDVGTELFLHNNVFARAHTFTVVFTVVADRQKPDLVVARPTVSKNTLAPGERFTLSTSVKNAGDGGADSTTLRYYRSSDSRITTSDTEVGTDSVSTLGANRSSDESITLTAPTSAGTYYYGACVDSVTDESNSNNNCSAAVSITVEVLRSDLVVARPTVSKSTLAPGERFTLSATVANNGAGSAAATTLRYYRSTDATITTSDTEVGTDSVSALSANRSSDESISLTAPSSPGTYYYGACVDSVTDESNSNNNCSTAVSITVEVLRSDLVVARPTVSQSTLAPGERFTLSTSVRNAGEGGADSTTSRYYRSADAIITTSDTLFGAYRVSALGANQSDTESISLTAPTSPGTYYYGACVDSVSDESNSNNNCSAAVSITVNQPTLSTSIPSPLVETTLAGSEVTLTLTDATYEPSLSNIRNAVTVSGIAGVTVGAVRRVSEAEITVELAFDGTNFDTDATLTFTVEAEAIAGYNGPELTAQVSVTAIKGFDFDLSVPAGMSMIHVPLNVTKVDGVAKTLESISDLYNALGGAAVVIFLITYDSATGDWLSYFGASDKDTAPDRTLTDDMGIMANLVTPTTIRLTGDALGTDGTSTVTLNQGLNLVGLPLRDSRITRVSDLLALGEIRDNVPVIIFSDNGEFKAVGRAGDPGDIEITGGQSFILTAQRAATVGISGEAWTNVSGTAAAPPVTRRGIEVGEATPVLALTGSIVDERPGVNTESLRVTVKNLTTDRAVASVTARDEADYRLTVIDIEMGRAATLGDVLEISVHSPNRLIGAEPLRHIVTVEDVKRSRIHLPELVVYEIPSETQLLRNYPNPFNPETWIPYHLANDTDVSLFIYDMNGALVRELDLGHQRAGYYTDRSRAAYWDGRNGLGERVASGVYFYQLRAGDYLKLRKMVILK